MTQRKEAGRAVTHLTAVWLVGCVLTSVQLQAVFVALFTGGAVPFTVVLVGVALLAVAVLAWLGTAVRAIVPLTSRARGPWTWAVGVYALGTVGAFGAAVVNFKVNRLEDGLLFCSTGGACYALAAALFLPDTRFRLGALGAAAVLVVGGTYAVRAATQPPTLDEWITANGVDRSMLRVGDPPPGYTLRILGAGEEGFGAEYERSHPARRLHLGVERAGHDPRRVDARGCPVPFGEPIHCADDGGGRQLLTYEGGHEHRELRLRRDGLVYTVTVEGHDTDLSAARHILATLGPATDAELAGLLELPMRR
ncbi:hypothetical protein F0L17_25595 [Streptomyces sp. TRM43335]|uniref:Uncharacterized protein n=1 Tax=Streptomyces taklimakanensis TaxID=2569853 RepID=A0A6G2BJF7_9ACTN|nr:hypothetical protein [Streptomyces taklimakanensis]MTE22415.1 hypothetical protein [Streptomyces taklimakanensis]